MHVKLNCKEKKEKNLSAGKCLDGKYERFLSWWQVISDINSIVTGFKGKTIAITI